MKFFKGLLIAISAFLILSGCGGVKEVDSTEGDSGVEENAEAQPEAVETPSSDEEDTTRERTPGRFEDDEVDSEPVADQTEAPLDAVDAASSEEGTPSSAVQGVETPEDASPTDSDGEGSEDADDSVTADAESQEEDRPPVTTPPSQPLIDLSVPSQPTDSQLTEEAGAELESLGGETAETSTPQEVTQEKDNTQNQDNPEEAVEEEASAPQEEVTQEKDNTQNQDNPEEAVEEEASAPQEEVTQEKDNTQNQDNPEEAVREEASAPQEVAQINSIEKDNTQNQDNPEEEIEGSDSETQGEASVREQPVASTTVAKSGDSSTGDASVKKQSPASTTLASEKPDSSSSVADTSTKPEPSADQDEQTSFFAGISDWTSSMYDSISRAVKMWLMEPATPSYYVERGRPYPPIKTASVEDNKPADVELKRCASETDTNCYREQVSEDSEVDVPETAFHLIARFHEKLHALPETLKKVKEYPEYPKFLKENNNELTNMKDFLSASNEISKKDSNELTVLEQSILDEYLEIADLSRIIQNMIGEYDDFQNTNEFFEFLAVSTSAEEDFSEPSLIEMHEAVQIFTVVE